MSIHRSTHVGPFMAVVVVLVLGASMMVPAAAQAAPLAAPVAAEASPWAARSASSAAWTVAATGVAPTSAPATSVAYGFLRTLESGPIEPEGIAVDRGGDVFIADGSGEVAEVPKGVNQIVPLLGGPEPPSDRNVLTSRHLT